MVKSRTRNVQPRRRPKPKPRRSRRVRGFPPSRVSIRINGIKPAPVFERYVEKLTGVEGERSEYIKLCFLSSIGLIPRFGQESICIDYRAIITNFEAQVERAKNERLVTARIVDNNRMMLPIPGMLEAETEKPVEKGIDTPLTELEQEQGCDQTVEESNVDDGTSQPLEAEDKVAESIEPQSDEDCICEHSEDGVIFWGYGPSGFDSDSDIEFLGEEPGCYCLGDKDCYQII